MKGKIPSLWRSRRNAAQASSGGESIAEDPNLPATAPTTEQMLSREVFADIDRHFARFMQQLSGATNHEVLLAAALASRYRGLGNICLDLASVAGTTFPEDPTHSGGRLQLPPLDVWVAALRQSPVVGRPLDFKPLILDAANRLYLHRYWQYEFNLAKAIRARAELDVQGINEPLLHEGLKRLFPAPMGATDTDWQRVAAATAVKKKLCVISGGPGTGKTRTVVALLVLLLEQAGNHPLRIALAAPTGKAAARLQESLKKWKTTLPCDESIKACLPEESFTLHRLLGGVPDSARFKYNEQNPLPFDVVVVDEASMVDLALMAKLFAATPSGARLVLLGDKDQLASVEAGAVLGDICADAGRAFRRSVPSASGDAPQAEKPPDSRDARPAAALAQCLVQLRKNYRFGAESGILALSQAINDGDAERALNLLNSGAHRGADRADAEAALAGAAGGIAAVALPSAAQLKVQLRARVVEGFGPLARAREPLAALHALSRFRILCAVRQGPFGVAAVNRVVEDILSEEGLISIRDRWYAGRPVLVTRNDYPLRLFNGDVGVILPDPVSGEPRAWFLSADNAPRWISPIRLPECETVFAMTVHKSQGSEFEEVLFILPDRESPVLTRELLYTSVTRASRRVECWFDAAVFRAAVGRQTERASGLREALWEGTPQQIQGCSVPTAPENRT